MKRNMDPVMVDLETLGVTPGHVILSIGAVKFDPGTRQITDRFYNVISVASCIDIGLEINSETVKWWQDKKPEAKVVLDQAYERDTWLGLDGINRPALPIQQALENFGNFVHHGCSVWGNGSDFDNAFLQVAYAKCGLVLPWNFWDNRCYRTVKNFYPTVHFKRIGTYHNAVDDAETQAVHLMDILSKVRGYVAEEGDASRSYVDQEPSGKY